MPTKDEIEKQSTTHLREESVEEYRQRRKNEEEAEEEVKEAQTVATPQNNTLEQQIPVNKEPVVVETLPQEDVANELIETAKKDLEDFFSDEDEK